MCRMKLMDLWNAIYVSHLAGRHAWKGLSLVAHRETKCQQRE